MFMYVFYLRQVSCVRQHIDEKCYINKMIDSLKTGLKSKSVDILAMGIWLTI